MFKIKVLVSAAWPYINYVPHLGNIIGSVLSADVVARYHRMKNSEVVFVSGSDEHGTPIEIEALKLGINPKDYADKNHEKIKSLFERWEISFDNYTRTESQTHKELVGNLLSKIYKNGYIYTQETDLLYCENCDRFLPDRFVEGTCPHCNYESARGDQCEKCGRLLDSITLILSRCTICGSSPEMKTSKHWFLDLPRFSEQIEKYLRENSLLPNNARNFSLGLIKEGLKPRPITRDNKWGIQAPFPGSEGKTIYVWIEAVLGYLSATIEYFEEKEGSWEDYWLDKEATTLYFVGKDNIPFHTIILPALLLATHEGYNLPGSVSSTEFLLYEGNKFSKSRRIGVWIDEALDLFPLEYWRYTLISIRPETKDTSFTWRVLLEKVNSDLNYNLGNFIYRTTTFINRYFNGSVPEIESLDKYDNQVLNDLNEKMKRIAESIERFRLQEALGTALSISQLGNRYLNQKEPWKTIKSNPQISDETLYIAVQIVKSLIQAFYPFIPSFSKKLSKALNLFESKHWDEWQTEIEYLRSGHKIGDSKALFEKILLAEKELGEKLAKSRSI